MTISIDKAQTAIMSYIENEIAKKATGVTKFATYFVVGRMQTKFPEIVHSLQGNPIVSAMGIFDDHGNVRVDEVYNAARMAMEKTGSVSVMGIIFNQADVDKLYQLMIS